jgi:hypothetical protein
LNGGTELPPGSAHTAPPRRGIVRPFHPRVPGTLRALYERYCTHEARALAELVGPDGRRALLRAEHASGGELSIDALERAGRRLLPLPPYERWLPDYLANRKAYLERMGIPGVPDRSEPVTVAIRPVFSGWWAHLELRHEAEGGVWVGFIAFRPERGGQDFPPPPSVRTADVFRGEDPEELRDRFLSFQPATMEGFFRSAAARPATPVL